MRNHECMESGSLQTGEKMGGGGEEGEGREREILQSVARKASILLTLYMRTLQN